MKRREFLGIAGGLIAAPALVRFARGEGAAPVVGFLHPGSAVAHTDLVAAFTDGLQEAGFIDGQNLALAYQWANDDTERLPALATELTHSELAVLAAVGHDAIVAAKAATSTIPIVFIGAEDPIKTGLVASLAQPGGNLTGVDVTTSELPGKRLEMLRTLVATATRVGLLVNPTDLVRTEANVSAAETAAQTLGMQIRVLIASTSDDIDAAFETIAKERLDALVADLSPFFTGWYVQLGNLASHYAVPTICSTRLYPEIGGLMSYGASLADAYHQAGAFAGRILKGEKPAEMPVAEPTKFELVLNIKTARRLGLVVPPAMLAQATKIIQ
jgi:putative tryptophan/tyrosine transport system substrate-binding protein